MKTIYKYRLPAVGNPFMSMPTGAEILHVGDQFGDLCVWALVDASKPYVAREFRVIGTGHPIDEREIADLFYLGTVQQNGGMLVWHVFVKGE